MQLNKRRLLLYLSILLAILIIFSIAINLRKNNITNDAVIITNININKDESVSFILINYKKFPVYCSAVLEVLQDSSVILTVNKSIGIIKPKQKINGIISGFEMPQGLSHINILPDCTDLI